MVKDIKLELQAIKFAQKTTDKVFNHMFTGAGYLYFNSEELDKPKLVINLGEAGELIYNTIKQKPVEFYFRSYASRYGKGVVPKDLIEYAYNQCKIDEKGRLVLILDFSPESVMRKYLGKPEVRVVDDIIFNDDKMSTIQAAFFHLFNTRLKEDKWCAFAVSMQYWKDDKKLTFDEFKEVLKKINVLK